MSSEFTPHSNKTSKLAIFLLVIIFMIIGSSGFVKGPFAGKGDVLGISFINFSALSSLFSFTSTFKFAYNSQELEKIVTKTLNGKAGDYAIYITDLTDDETYVLRASEPFPSASLYKLFLIAAVLDEIDKGNLTMETEMTASKAHLTEVLGSVDFGYEDREATIVYTVSEALERVGRISDNFASIMLAEKIGWEKIQTMADKLGASETRIKSPISTTASDIGRFFKLLYQKQVVSPASSDKIEEILTLSKINNRIPAKLPQDIKVVHKTGELSRLRHDAGLVYLNGRPYVIVLMSQNLKYEDEAIETLATISQDVFEYFKNKGN